MPRTLRPLRAADLQPLLLWVPLLAAGLGVAILAVMDMAAPPYLAILGAVIGYSALALRGPATLRRALSAQAVRVWSGVLLLTWICALYVLPGHPATSMILLASVLHLTTLSVLFFVAYPAEQAARQAALTLAIFVLSALPHSLQTLGGRSPFDSFTLPLTLLVAHGALIAVLLFFRRSQALVEQERRRAGILYELAHRDSLTGLHNRRALELDLAVAPPGRALLAIIDIDGLKAVNDALGHAVGDDLLLRFGLGFTRRVASSGRAYRLSGDEFALLVSAEPQEVEGWMDEVIREVQQVYPQTGASLGSAWRRSGETPSAWLSRADLAMYQHKQRRVRRSRSA